VKASQQAVIALEVLPMLEEEARKREITRGENAYNRNEGKQLVAYPETGQARDKAAELFGVNRQYISDAKMISKKAPEKLEEIRSKDKKGTRFP